MFKRDGFKCQYCGSFPPNVMLEIDHITPVYSGGTNDINNLITSCFDCNRGKAGNELTSIPQTIVEKSEGKKLALMQYREYQKLLSIQKKQIDKDIDFVESVYNSVFEDYVFSNTFRFSVKRFIDLLGIEEVTKAMEMACNKIYHEDKVLKYFCGICWNQIKER